MGDKSNIEWCDASWNPTRGCTKVSPGCKHCYAETFAERFRGTPGHAYEQGFDLRLVPESLDLPLRWKKPRTIFVNSMSDLFHKDISFKFLLQVFNVMEKAYWHTFLILTKRDKELIMFDHYLKDNYPHVEWPANVWMGVSVENKDYYHRIENLNKTRALVKFLSCEPLLGPLPNLPLEGISWVIVGGESGPHARPMEADWVRDIQAQCLKAETHFFFKQWGGVHKKETGRILDGQTWNARPIILKTNSGEHIGIVKYGYEWSEDMGVWSPVGLGIV